MKKRILIDLDELTKYCGHFVGDTNINNGYGCNHPDNEDQEKVSINENTPLRYKYEFDENGKHRLGLCYCSVCPFGYIPSLADLKELDKDLYNEYKDEKPEEKFRKSGFQIYVVSRNMCSVRKDSCP